MRKAEDRLTRDDFVEAVLPIGGALAALAILLMILVV